MANEWSQQTSLHIAGEFDDAARSGQGIQLIGLYSAESGEIEMDFMARWIGNEAIHVSIDPRLPLRSEFTILDKEMEGPISRLSPEEAAYRIVALGIAEPFPLVELARSSSGALVRALQ